EGDCIGCAVQVHNADTTTGLFPAHDVAVVGAGGVGAVPRYHIGRDHRAVRHGDGGSAVADDDVAYHHSRVIEIVGCYAVRAVAGDAATGDDEPAARLESHSTDARSVIVRDLAAVEDVVGAEFARREPGTAVVEVPAIAVERRGLGEQQP